MQMGQEGTATSPQKFVEGREEHRERARGAPDVPPAWDFGSSGRPATPQTAAFGQPAAPAAPRQQRPAGTGTPPAPRPAHGLFRSMRMNSGSLTGLLKRPGTAGEQRGGSPLTGASGAAAPPLFELRGAGLLPPEPPHPTTTAAASPPARAATAQHHPYHPKVASPAYSIYARAGQRATGGNSASPHAASPQQRHQHQSPAAVVAAHALDLGTSPQPTTAVPAVVSPAALSLAHQLQLKAAAVVAAATLAPVPASAAQQQQPASATPPTQQQQHHTFSVPLALAMQGSTSRVSGVYASGSVSVQTAASGTATTVHQNPLYAGASESSAASRAHQQQQQPPPRALRPPPALRVLPADATSTPPTPLPAGASSGATGAPPGVSPLAHLQAASNLTMASDSRPISPGPFLSILTSCALADSRPISPQCMDSMPPTPGSFAHSSSAVRAAALTPIHTIAPQPSSQSRSLPASPAPAAAPAGSSPQQGAALQAAAAAAFRLPIFNQEGRLVGYKQNSNLMPRSGACISSAPSSPSHTLVHSTDIFQGSSQDAGAAAGRAAAPAKAPPQVPLASSSSDFREFAAQPYKGFSDADNVVPGYVLGPVLGKGGFCSVHKALHQLTGQTVACKIIEKGKLKDPKDRDRVDRECRVMRNLSNHCAVVRLFEYVETRDHVYIMMEAAARGSLLDYVREHKKLPEEEAVQIFQQLLHALQFCHRKDVVHRDIKLENILIDSGGRMKLIDFGLCGYYVAGKRLRCHCGSPSYAAPEIVARKDYLGPPVDVWSLGIVLFAMLAGYLPFHAKEKRQLSEKILAGVYKPGAWMSPAAQDLIARMLTLDPDQRITLEQAWAHPWVASAPRWQPLGVGAGRLYRALTDPATGAILPDEAVLVQLEVLGADVAAIRRALRFRECNSLTATYHLMFEAHVEAQRAATAATAAQEREAAAAATAAAAVAKKGAMAASSADWQWDFAAISAATTTPSSGSVAGSAGVVPHASACSSSLRGSGSPARPRTAAVPACTGSPTRFGQEAAAAGYLSPRRPPTATAVAGPHSWSPFLTAVPSPLCEAAAAVAGAGPGWTQQHAERDAAFVIKALHPAGSSTEAGVLSSAVAAVAAELATSASPLLVTTAATIVATTSTTAEGPCPTPKLPYLSPLPTVMSPKQLQMGSSGDGADLGISSPQPMPQAA